MTQVAWFTVLLLLVVFGVLFFVRRPGTATDPRSATGADGDRSSEIVERIAEGVVLLDGALRPLFANAAARQMLGFRDPWLPDELPAAEVTEVARVAARGHDSERTVTILSPLPMDLKVRAMRLDDPPGIVVSLQDVTEENRAQRVRREFVTNASHELKSPVAGMQTLAEAVASATVDDPDAAARFAGRLVAEADRLSRLIQDLLDLSRLEEQPAPVADPVSLSIVARREVETVLPIADAKAIALEVEVEPNVHVAGDEQQLGLLVRNLLENAVRYTPEGGSVVLVVRPEGDDTLLVIKDDGIGIPREAHDRIFERFYRVDRARSRQTGGTGLGLAIVKHVAELHGGEVSLVSEPDRGSTFTVRLPRVASSTERTATALSEPAPDEMPRVR